MFSTRYGQSLSLLTDLYQLTMAYGYWKSGNADKEAVFHLSFRQNPFQGGFAIFCGLTHVVDFLQNFRFDESDLAFVSSLKAADNTPMFSPEFIDFLGKMQFSCDIDCMPEGSVVFAHEPMVRVKGPIIQCQILETILLNIISFQTLIATKASRVRFAAGDKRVMEFGLRRAQGGDGALSASWACYVGGVDSTSNVLAGKLYGIPVVGTLAHSWVMSFDNELESFQAYAEAMPNNCIFLVDTYDTLQGVRHAVEVGTWLKKNGYKLQGVRLDSGDLAYLSVEARKILDENGFQDAFIVASNDLDEHIINSLKDQGALVDVWAVGTKLITAADQPSLGGVYKLGAVRKTALEPWQYRIKLSEQVAKITTPGVQQVRRYLDSSGGFVGDMIYDEESINSGNSGKIEKSGSIGKVGDAEQSKESDVRNGYEKKIGSVVIVDPIDFTRRKKMSATSPFVDMLVPIFRNGSIVYELPDVNEIRNYARKQLANLHPSIKRLLNPHQYPVGLESGLHNLKTELILQARAQKET